MQLRGADGMLGILPGGRGNDLARVLGIPSDPVAACDVLQHGNVQRLDLGEVDGRTFVGIASCGFDSEANRIANETRLVRGQPGLRLRRPAGADRLAPRAVHGHPRRRQRPTGFRGYSVAAANSKAYGGGMLLAPDASLQDGVLDVVLIADGPKLRFMRLLPSVFKGEHVHHEPGPGAAHAGTDDRADRPFTVYADGDPIGDLPARIRALPGAIQALVPAAG